MSLSPEVLAWAAPGCAVLGCLLSVEAQGYCNPHYQRWYRHGDPLAGGPSRFRDERIGYHGRHLRVRRSLGKASEYACAECDVVAEQWAQTHETTGLEVSHYRPLCISCHTTYDMPLKPRGESNGWSKLTVKEVREIKHALLAGVTCSELGRKYGVNHKAISQIKLGRTWKHVEIQDD
jgi:hypothetical protein